MADINLEKLAEFLVKAKKATYAGEGAEVEAERQGFKELEYKEGKWEYRDSYIGFFLAPGQEVVRFKGKPVWAMSYSGGIREEHRKDIKFAKKVFSFLKKALSNVSKDMPFRGPVNFDEGKIFDKGDFRYFNFIEGNIEDFSGLETITYKGEEVFRQKYIGGLVKNK